MGNQKAIRMYATKLNPKSNDFNDEAEYIEVPYDVWDCKNGECLVNRAGWNGRKHKHYVKEIELHFIK